MSIHLPLYVGRKTIQMRRCHSLMAVWTHLHTLLWSLLCPTRLSHTHSNTLHYFAIHTFFRLNTHSWIVCSINHSFSFWRLLSLIVYIIFTQNSASHFSFSLPHITGSIVFHERQRFKRMVRLLKRSFFFFVITLHFFITLFFNLIDYSCQLLTVLHIYTVLSALFFLDQFVIQRQYYLFNSSRSFLPYAFFYYSLFKLIFATKK